MRYLLVLLAFIVFSGCELLGPSTSGDVQGTTEVRVQVESDAIVVTNHTGEAIYYAVFGQNIAAVINWTPLIGDENRVDARRALTVPVDEILMDGEEEKLLFYWWRPNKDASAPDAIRTVVISL